MRLWSSQSRCLPEGTPAGSVKRDEPGAKALTGAAGTLITSNSGPLVVGPGPVIHAASWIEGKVIISAPHPTPTPTTEPRPEPCDICVTVFNDFDEDRDKDAGEPAVPGAVIEVYSHGNSLEGKYTTDDSEPNCFAFAPDVKYRVRMCKVPAGYRSKGPKQAVVYAPSGIDLPVDFALVQRLGAMTQAPGCSLRGNNRNRLCDPDEPTLPSRTIKLVDERFGDAFFTQTISDTGRPAFGEWMWPEDLLAGSYLATQEPVAGWDVNAPAEGATASPPMARGSTISCPPNHTALTN